MKFFIGKLSYKNIYTNFSVFVISADFIHVMTVIATFEEFADTVENCRLIVCRSSGFIQSGGFHAHVRGAVSSQVDCSRRRRRTGLYSRHWSSWSIETNILCNSTNVQ